MKQVKIYFAAMSFWLEVGFFSLSHIEIIR